MQANERNKRPGRRLLVAALGVATVSYVETQSGCVMEEESDEYTETEEGEEELGVSQQALTGSEVAVPADVRIKLPLPPSGNLMAPERTVPQVLKPLPPSGNLMAPELTLEDLIHIYLQQSGNLVPPVVVKLEDKLDPDALASDLAEVSAVEGKQ